MFKKQFYNVISVLLVTNLLLSCNLPFTVYSSDIPSLEFVSPCVWKNIGYQYSEGLVTVQEQDFNGVIGKWGYMDRFGKLQIPVQWESTSSFHEGLAAVQLDGKWGYINQSGDVVIPLQFGYAGDFSEGMAVVRDMETNKSGYIDTSGNVIVPLEYDIVFSFSNGYGKVRMNAKEGKPETYHIFDKNGVMNPLWDSIGGPYLPDNGYFADSLAWVTGPGGRGYINETGELVISLPPNSYGYQFNSGRALVSVGTSGFDTVYYYIDTTGQRVIDVETELNIYPNSFYEGYALIPDISERYSSAMCIIDTGGTVVAKITQENRKAYNEDMKVVWLYDGHNKKVYSYHFTGNFSELEDVYFYVGLGWGVASTDNAIIAAGKTENGHGYGVFDKNLNQIIPFEYAHITALSDDYFLVSKNSNGGAQALIDRNNNIISDYANLRFNSPKEDRFVVQSGSGYGVVRLFDDGEIYQKEAARVTGTAQATDITINTVPEKAYATNGNTYVNIETLRKYGLSIVSTNDGNNFQITRQVSKNKTNIADTFMIKDEYNIYSSEHKVFVNGDVVDSLQIENDIVVNVNSLHPFGTVQQNNGVVNLYIDRPYMQYEGITWEWRTDMFSTSRLDYEQGTYALQGSGLGIKIFSVDGKLLYQDENASYCVPHNGLWKVSRGYMGDQNQTLTYVNLNGEVVDAPSGTIQPSPTPSPTLEPEYPMPLYEQKNYWDGSLNGSTRPVDISTGKYVDENGSVVLENSDWTWTEPFYKGTALVNTVGSYTPVGYIEGGQWGIIDTSGNYIVKPIWNRAGRANDGNIVVTLDSKDGLVDGYGNQKIPFEYDRIYYYSSFNNCPILQVEVNDKSALIGVDNNVILPFMFDYIGMRGNNYYAVGTYFADQHMTGMIELIETPYLQGDVFVNGVKVEFDNPPLLINDRTMIPVRAVFEKLDFNVDWEDETQTVMIDGNNSQIRIIQDKNGFLKNGEYSYSDMPSFNYCDRIYLPLRAISEALGCRVNYDDATGSVTIDY